MTEFDVVVVGSCMIDLTCCAPRLPKSGETLCGSNFVMGYGGKGCNQCVSARKLGAKCSLIARIGNDPFGQNYYTKINEYGISTGHVQFTSGVSTGMAQITVTDTGENHIIVVLGANEKLSERDIVEASKEIINCKVLVCQMEIPESSTLKALQLKAESKKGKSILNAAPAKPDLNSLLYSLPDVFCVNETEAEILTEVKIVNHKTAEEAVKKLLAKGCKSVILTLGENGSIYGEKESAKYFHIPTLNVKAVDTTGAGDAFLGALAYYLSAQPDMPMKEMIKKANEVAAISVQKLGTQESFPDFAELPQSLKI